MVAHDGPRRRRGQHAYAPGRLSVARCSNCAALVHHERYATRTHATAAIREWIEIFYNRQRCHSRLGNVVPAVFAQ